MKKILAVLLSIMMLFGAVSMSASAATAELYLDVNTVQTGVAIGNYTYETGDIVVRFNVQNGVINRGVTALTTVGTQIINGISSSFLMVTSINGDHIKAGSVIDLPFITAVEGKSHTGWKCEIGPDKQSYTAGQTYTVPEGYAGTYIEFTPTFEITEPDEDTMTTIMNVLVKVFGAIIGLIVFTGDMEKGQALVQEMLGSLFA